VVLEKKILKFLNDPIPFFRLPYLAHWFWRKFKKFSSVFLLICCYFSLGMGIALHLNNIESLSPKDDLCQVWLKLAKWFWRRS
jgi:hypothetical protein